MIVDKYLAAYGASDDVTQSAFDQSKVVALRQAVETLGGLLRAGLSVPLARLAIYEARRRVQHYYTPEYVDLVDLCRRLKSPRLPAAARAACDAVIRAARAFVVKNGSKGSGVARSSGVSIYFPTNGVSPLYRTLDFARQSQWARFIAAF